MVLSTIRPLSGGSSPGPANVSKNLRMLAANNCSSRTTSRSVNVGSPSQSATISWKILSVSGRCEFRIASSNEGNSTISMKWVASERSLPITLCVAVRLPLVLSTHVSISWFISSNRLVLQSMSCTNVMASPPAPWVRLNTLSFPPEGRHHPLSGGLTGGRTSGPSST